MRAITFQGAGQAPTLTDVSITPAGEGEVQVQLKAASLNHRDVWMTKGLYPNLRTGAIMGSCGAGVFNGREVLINPNVNWGPNPAYPDHSQYSILGMPVDGTFAECITVPEHRLLNKPHHLSWEEAAALPLAGLTAYRALFTKGRVNAGDKVLISGVGGGVALMALQLALAAKAEVFVSSSSQEKIDKAVALGAKGGVLYTDENWGNTFLAAFGGVDVVIDSAAGAGYGQFLKIANPLARIVNYGGTKGKASINPQALFWKELQLLGSTMGSDAEFEDMVAFVAHHKIHPVVDTVFAMEEHAKALSRMDEGLQFGKIVLSIS